jgi:hypothetical protein
VPLAIVWLVGFAIYYFTRTIPNNGIDRITLAFLLPEISSLFADNPDSGWRYLPQRFDLIATAVPIFAGAWGLGGLLLRALGLGLEATDERDGRTVSHLWFCASERHVVAIGLGLSAWSLLTLGFGLAGWLSRPLFAGVLISAAVLEAALVWRNRKTAIGLCGVLASTSLMVPCGVAMVPFAVLAALGSMLPPFDFDVKEYHLGGPKEWFLDGRVHFLPHNVYTSFPFLTEMLSLSAMVLRGDWFRGALAGQFVLCGFLPLTVAAIFFTGRRLFGTAAGLLGAVAYITTPWAYRISVIAYAEGGLTSYLAFALLAAVIAIDRLRSGAPASRTVLLVGLFAGSAMACKYPGVVQVVIPIGAALVATDFIPRRSPPAAAGGATSFELRDALKTAAIYSLGVLLAVGPWLVKNAVETRNPVYPLLWSVFDGRDWDAELNAKWNAAHSPPHYHPAAFFTDMADVAAVNDWQGLLVFGLAPLALLGPMRRRAAMLWLFVGYLYAAWWLLTHRIDRFWVPLLPPACVLAGAGALWAEDLPRRIGGDLGDLLRTTWRFACGAAVVAATLFGVGFDTTPFAGNPSYLADLASASRAVEKPGLAILNRTLPPGSKVLLVGEAEILDARFPLIYNTVFDDSIFKEWTAATASGVPPQAWPLRPGDDIRRTFEEHGVTHVYVNWSEILRYRTTYGYTPFVTPERFDELRRLGVLGEPKDLQFVPADRLSHEKAAEAERAFPSLFRGQGEARIFVADQLYPVVLADRGRVRLPPRRHEVFGKSRG